MKSYSSASLTALFFGWLIATAFYLLCYYVIFRFQESSIYSSFYIAMMCVFSLVFSAIANALFIFPFRNYVDKLVAHVPKIAFALVLALYSLIIFIPILSWLTGATFEHPQHRLIFADAAVNGFVYGLIYYSLRKPVSQVE